MSRFFESGKDIGRYLIFLVVIILIYLGMPKEGKFKYEYSLNELWKHDDLVAPFTFAIKKTQEEIDLEENQIRESIKPYYNKVTEAEKNITDKLYNSFNYFVKQGFDTLSPITQTLAKTRVKSTILTAFDAGIVLEKPQHKTINILHNNISKEKETSTLYTLDGALNFISNEIESDTHFGKYINIRAIRKLVKPNLSYNADLTEKKIEEELDKISVSKGIVQEGTKIIAKGNAVTEEKFQILESLKTEYEIKLDGGERNYFIHIGYLLLVTLVIIGFAIYLRQFYKPIYTSKNIILILINILGFILIGSYVVSSKSLDIYLVPFCIVPIILISFFDARIAFFSHLITVIIVSLFAPNGFEFLFIQVMVGMAVIIGISRVRYLSQFFIASLVILFVYYISFFGVKLVQVNSLRDIDYTTFLWFTGNFLLTLLAYPLIFAFEKIFGFVSDITLIEMSDLNKKLLRDLSLKAPGTLQHSLQVANLTEAVLNKIGGNALLARVGALYHDIGKMHAPEYFTENQKDYNPHDELNDKESARIIIEHVTKGIQMAKEHNLPKEIIDFIKTHHGTTRVEYFYRNYLNNHPEEEVNEKEFMYPGPKPNSKETAVLMIVDSVEAASRSLKKPDAETLEKLVDNLTDGKLNQNQFENADISLKEINQARSILKENLKTIYHSRIEYPKEIEKKENNNN